MVLIQGQDGEGRRGKGWGWLVLGSPHLRPPPSEQWLGVKTQSAPRSHAISGSHCHRGRCKGGAEPRFGLRSVWWVVPTASLAVLRCKQHAKSTTFRRTSWLSSRFRYCTSELAFVRCWLSAWTISGMAFGAPPHSLFLSLSLSHSLRDRNRRDKI